MLQDTNMDQILDRTEKQIRELELEIERLNREMNQYFDAIGMKPEEFEAFFSNPDNFTSEGWRVLEQERKRQDEELEKRMSHIRDLNETKKRYSSLNLPSYAIFVK